ncbi:hypothetical protein RN001_001475 [Aquatica leii]|uniref:DNA-directed DNA polymerase n=1 Tax=Aquatica leii TaxID=1421715 RepID=A0AAN7PG07_9COLE|nr:hypothetical protein RN001_001475 [Aquatica leii]
MLFQKYFQQTVPMKSMSREELLNFTSASNCHICEESFKDEIEKVRDHCHFSGRYRGAAHSLCNLNFKCSQVIPVVFHSLSNYDGHLFIRNLVKKCKGKIDLLPLNKERYISFTITFKNGLKFRFIDSFRFMNSSLDKLASYMDKDHFHIVKSHFRNLTETQFNLISKKGIYPYDYTDSYSKLASTTKLPAKEHFFNSLTNKDISDGDYNHAQTVWNEFNIKNLGEYSDLYLKSDVLILADVFENFRNSCMTTYKLDPVNFFSLPGFTWSAMLKYTKVELELISDIDVLMFVERGIRGGLSQCSIKYSKANNKYLNDRYNPNESENYLIYLDINNLYGLAMSQYLPYGGFKWLNVTTEITNFILHDVKSDSDRGYLLEVDLEYPRNIHDLHNHLPLCAEHKCPPGSKQKKLLATLESKSRYVIHYRNLQQCVKLGMLLRKVHRILEFKQSAWLKNYIDLNTRLRTQATNEFERNQYKLINNAVFGKTMENIRKHRVVKFVKRWHGRYGAEHYISQPNFHSSVIFNNNTVAIEMNKTEILFNKPIYVGMCILDVSKIFLYRFHYDYMLQKFGHQNCHLLYTHTDSLIYNIQHNDIYETIKRDSHMFDTSGYAEDNIFGISRLNKKVLGMMKDECNGGILYEFVGLKSKLYSFKVQNPNDINNTNTTNSQSDSAIVIKKAKGVLDSVVRNTISFDDYLKCIRENVTLLREQRMIRSSTHDIFTIKQNRVALAANDDKRCIQPDGIHTLAWGHYLLSDC